jgi:prepilin-type N-terminal cleavage/methylation domain-containing protein
VKKTFPVSTYTARQSSRSGFTLVELLVVIGIIALLAAVSIAGITSALKSARRALCLSHMRSIGAAVMTYSSDNNLDFPVTDNGAWDVALNPYLGENSTTTANPVLECPEDSRPLTNGSSFARSYSFNDNIGEGTSISGTPRAAKTVQVPAPSQTIMLAEWYTGGNSGPGGAGANYQYAASFNHTLLGRHLPLRAEQHRLPWRDLEFRLRRRPRRKPESQPDRLLEPLDVSGRPLAEIPAGICAHGAGSIKMI